VADDLPLLERDDLSGVRIGGFEILERIGRGANSTVYKARQTSMDRVVAFKVVPGAGPNAVPLDAIERFLREARISARLSHPNIVHGIDAGEQEGLYFFAAEFVEGRDLDYLITQTGGLGELEGLDIARQVALGLQHAAEAGIVHRDIKPANIIVNPRGVAKLVDLGLARAIGGEQSMVTQAGTVVGTPYYLSPEQARGEAHVDIRSDIYSLGATLYHTVVGDVPFDAPTAMMVIGMRLTQRPPSAKDANPRVSEQLDAILHTMMSTDKEKRHPDYAALLRDMDRVIRLAKARSVTEAAASAADGAQGEPVLPDEDALALQDSRVIRNQKQPAKPAPGGAEPKPAAAKAPAGPKSKPRPAPRASEKVSPKPPPESDTPPLRESPPESDAPPLREPLPASPSAQGKSPAPKLTRRDILGRETPYPGGWSVFTTESGHTSDLEFDTIIEMIEKGEIDRYTTISGPTTGFRHAAAEETPMVSKFLGLCFRCKEGVHSTHVHCPHCRCHLDKPYRGAGGERDAGKLRRALRIARLKRVLLGLLTVFFVWTCTNWWRPFVPAGVEKNLLDGREQLGRALLVVFQFGKEQVLRTTDPEFAERLAEWESEIQSAREAYDARNRKEAVAAYERARTLIPGRELSRDDRQRYEDARSNLRSPD
jgi:serine/threonine protein kinase